MSSLPAADERPGLTLVVPTYNERERLEELVSAVVGALQTHAVAVELIIVDDNSPDGTGDLADRLSERYPLRVIHRAGKLGLGTAVMEGFVAARTSVFGVMDGDLSHPTEALPRMWAVLGETDADVVVASRYIPGGGVHNWPLHRRLMSRLACRLTWPLTPVRDATSGFFLIRREAVEGVDIRAGGFKICLELLVRGRGKSVVEVPYTFTDRAAGKSKMTLREALGFVRQLGELYRYHFLDRPSPVHRMHRAAATAPGPEVIGAKR